MSTATEAIAVTALIIAGTAAVIDTVKYEIPDSASIAISGLALVFGMLEPGFSWWSHLAAPMVMFGVGLLAFSRGWLGGGDVKLMTAIAAWTGLGGLPLMFLATSIAGGVLALGLTAARRMMAMYYHRHGSTLQSAAPVPYAVAIVIGTFWWLYVTGGGRLMSMAG